MCSAQNYCAPLSRIAPTRHSSSVALTRCLRCNRFRLLARFPSLRSRCCEKLARKNPHLACRACRHMVKQGRKAPCRRAEGINFNAFNAPEIPVYDFQAHTRIFQSRMPAGCVEFASVVNDTGESCLNHDSIFFIWSYLVGNAVVCFSIRMIFFFKKRTRGARLNTVSTIFRYFQ